MVKTEDTPDMADGWREVFKRSRVLPPPSQTVRLALDNHFTQSLGSQLTLSRLTAAHLPQVMCAQSTRNAPPSFRNTWGRGIKVVVFERVSILLVKM